MNYLIVSCQIYRFNRWALVKNRRLEPTPSQHIHRPGPTQTDHLRCAGYSRPKGSQHASSSCAQDFARLSNYPSCNPWVTATITQHYDLKKGRPRWRYRGIQSRPPNFEMVLLQMHGESTAAKCNANTNRTEAIAILCLCHESTWQKAWWIHRCKPHANAQNIKPRGLSKETKGSQVPATA